MNRKEFIRNSAALGLGLPFLASLLSSCDQENDLLTNFSTNFNGKVLVIGAGAAGLTAGHILNKNNIDFQIIEASSIYGGRIKKTAEFAEFPIDLGGEWIHTDPSILATLLNEPDTDVDIEIINYNPQTVSVWKNGKLRRRNVFSNFYKEHKFKNTTWYGFFENYIVPTISDRIVYNSPVKEINYSGDKVLVKTSSAEIYEADKILITVPISILQAGLIEFQPPLPSSKTNAINDIFIPDGIKVFMEFSERFYPDITLIGGLLDENAQEKIYYDAAFGKDSNQNILALFNVGESASKFTNMDSEQAIIDAILEELDEMFDGQASATYQKHIIQNWSTEPYIQGSYSHYGENSYSVMETITEPLENKVYFAGEALNLNGDYATVHGAGESAYLAIEKLLKT